ncbi:MAG: hypothetical protein KDD45_08565 [Bdellovibrionales bacterium]|nr:hypothetical protein [Bdellovibrionales bacterium]
MPPKLPPLHSLDNLKTKADLIPEIFFFGQIVGGEFESEDALLCEMTVDTGHYWELIYPGKEKTYQSQTTYADVQSKLIRKENYLYGRILLTYTSKLMNSLDGNFEIR